MISLHTFLSCANRKPPSKVICCLLCVLNFRSYHILKNFKLPFKIPQERIHKFPIGRLPPSMVGNHWLRTCPPLFCLPLSHFLSSASRVPLPLLAKVIMHSHAMLWYSCVCVATIGRIWDWQIALNLQSFHFFVVTSKEYWQDLSHRKFH